MIRTKVLLFARVKEAAGVAAVEFDFQSGSTVGDVRWRLGEEFPQLATLLPHCLFAVNDAYADDGREIRSDEEIACIPPVSGG